MQVRWYILAPGVGKGAAVAGETEGVDAGGPEADSVCGQPGAQGGVIRRRKLIAQVMRVRVCGGHEHPPLMPS